jgi:hypothetical protein
MTLSESFEVKPHPIIELLALFMDSSGHLAESDGPPYPRVIDVFGVFIAILTLTLPVYMISLYSSPAASVQPRILLGQEEVRPGLSP